MIGRIRGWLGRMRLATSRPPEPDLPPAATLADELTSSGSSVDAWVRAARAGARLYSSLSSEEIQRLRDRCAVQSTATIAAADRVIAHEFDLLGSGPFVPVDSGRGARNGYQPIDWYLDPVQKLRFPERIPIDQWNLMAMRPGLADIKFPWEISRCQHWLPLAQAFRITGDVRYASEILDELEDFMQANPVGLGINWTCTMDVALRALNWALALELIAAGDGVDARRLAAGFSAIFDHGHFIERHLENNYEVTSNHFLSNVVGLHGIAVLFRGLPSADRWSARCRAWLEQEIRVQVLDDGADYESSIPYHRLVAELFLSGWRLSHCEAAPLSSEFAEKLRRMIEFHKTVLRPDGLMPQVGDADDGRVHIFSNYGRWLPQDGRHLLNAAAGVFDRGDWVVPEDGWGQWEAAWWGATLPAPLPAAAEIHTLLPHAGVALSRRGATYLLVSNAKVGTSGFGNHKHNDLLSFEFHDEGVPLFVDPGSYVYTSNPGLRNRFRATASHNTLVVDATEQNEFKPEWLFRMFEKATPTHVSFDAADGKTAYRGRHDGYARLASSVMHERAFTLDHASGRLQIEDLVSGAGVHELQWHFHCAPGVDVSTPAPGRLSLAVGSRVWTLRADAALQPSIDSGWYSPSYGVKVAARVIRFEARPDLSLRQQWSFVLERAR